MSNIGLCKEEIIINKTFEITKSLCDKYVGLSASIDCYKRKYNMLYSICSEIQSIKISFIYNPVSFDCTSHVYTVYPHDIIDVEIFEKVFREKVIEEVINNKDRFERMHRRSIDE